MYVVSAATGNTGHVVTEYLLSRGRQVRAVSRSLEKLQPLTAQGAEPFRADIADPRSLTQALKGAEAAYLVMPPDFTVPDSPGFQRLVADSFARAVADSGVKNVVFLSSMGAQHEAGAGPISGLAYTERRLSEIDALNLLAIRAGYFMENLFATIPVLRQYGFIGTAIRPDLPLPMIATKDVGRYAGERLDTLDFSGKEARELLGQRDVTMVELTGIMGRAIGRPELEYRQFDDQAFRHALRGIRFSQSGAESIVEMAHALNGGLVKATEKRSETNTTPTSIEDFVRTLAALYEVQPA